MCIVCALTIQRALAAAGFKWKLVRQVPMLSPAQRTARVSFAQRHVRTRWRSIMFTNSKYFTMHPVDTKQRMWCAADTQPAAIGVPKHSPALHVYMGVTWFGCTKLVLVSGGSTKSTYKNDRGQLYRGVCASEYQEKVLPELLQGGCQLFAQSEVWRDQWMFQQDGPAIHRAKESIVIASTAPGGLLSPWPANSPDLSWIENVWAWMDKKLRSRPVCTSTPHLWTGLNEFQSSIPLHVLQNCVQSMPRRLQDVVAGSGIAVR